MKIRPSNPPLWFVNLTALCVGITLSFSLIYSYADNYIKIMTLTQRDALKALPQIQTLALNPFAEIVLVGKAAVVYDVSRDKIVFAQNAEAQLPLASLTKLMTAVIATETLPPYTAIEILPRQIEHDVQLKVGERWPLKDLLAYTLMTSSNTGADSMAAAAASFLGGTGTSETRPQDEYSSLFIKQMNEKAHALRLNQTYFLNPSGLDTNTQTSGSYGSAKDVASLIAYIITKHPNLLETTERVSETFIAPDGRKIQAHNTNEYAVTVPGIIGSKTGLTNLAGGNLAVAFDASFGEPFVVVVLSSTEKERFTDIEKLVTATISYLGTGLKTPLKTADNNLPTRLDISYNAVP